MPVPVPLALILISIALMPGSPDAGQAERVLPAGPRPVVNWPVILGNSIRYTPAVADIDGDGRDEIAVSTKDCRAFLLDWRGESLPGWPVETDALINRALLLDDIDGDARFEVAGATTDRLLHLWGTDGIELAGWPVELAGNAASAPLLIRDRNTGRRSILISTWPGGVYLFSPGGDVREGWPKLLEQSTNSGYADNFPTCIADLDSDGTPEVMHLTTQPPVLYCWRIDGSAYPGFPVEIEGDGGLGLAVDDPKTPRHIALTTRDLLFVIDLETGLELRKIGGVAGDEFVTAPFFTGEEGLLMTSSRSGYVSLREPGGEPLAGWPVRLDGFIYGLKKSEEKHMVYGPPVAADVDGDGERELIVGSYNHHLYSFEMDGAPVPGWPVVLDDFIVQALALAQLDGEGAEELVVGQFGETLFAYHIGHHGSPAKKEDGRLYRAHSEWPQLYNLVALLIFVMLVILTYMARQQIFGEPESRARMITGSFVFILVVLLVRILFISGDISRYRAAMGRLEKAEKVVISVLEETCADTHRRADMLADDLRTFAESDLRDPHRALRPLERLSDRNRLEYRFNGVLLAEETGEIIRGVGLGRGWMHLDQMGLDRSMSGEPVMLGDIPVYLAESTSGIAVGEDSLRFIYISSILNNLPNALADSTGFSAHIQIDDRTVAWGGAGPRTHRNLRPWLGVVQPVRYIAGISSDTGPRLTILLAKEDFENPQSQWLDLAAVIILPVLYLIVISRTGGGIRVRLRWWYLILFMVLYVTGEILLHNNRLETGPVPLAGRGLEVLLHMVGITGVVIILHRIATSRRSRRLNFALLGSYLIVSLIPLSVILIAGGSLFIEVQNGLIEETIEDLESQAENMVLSYMGNSSFINGLRDQFQVLLQLSTETSWYNFVAEDQYLFNYDLPAAYLTLWAHDVVDPGRYFTGYSYMAPRTGKLYNTKPGWCGDENVSGLFLDNGTPVVRATREYKILGLDMELVAHVPVDEGVLEKMEERLRVLPLLPRFHLEPTWLESSGQRSRPEGWYFPYSTEFVLQAQDWYSGRPRWIVYRASMYMPVGRESFQVLIPIILLILLPLGLSFWGAYTTYRRTASPLTRLLTGITRVGDGDLDYRLEDTGKTEIGLASRAFDSMADSLEETIAELAEKRKLEEITELKSRFISMVSHDLKTPLSAIQGAADNMLEEVVGPVTDRQRKYLEMIHRSGVELQKMITGLLDLSRIESGRLELAIEPIDIRRLAEDSIRSVQPLFEKRGLKGIVDVRTADTIVRGDKSRVLQVISNLISNAIRHSPEGGTIRISIEDAPVEESGQRSMKRISVSDEGPGIAEDEADKLFEPFFYSTHSESVGHGAGLGLAIVKQLIELHGGTVEMYNSPSGGAVCSFILPT